MADDIIPCILARLKGVRQLKPDQWQALCPGHADTTPSLSIRKAADRVLLKCFAGCQLRDILKPLELRPQDLFFNQRPKPTKRRIVAVYQYSGFEVVRYEPKGFAQRRPDNNGGFVWNVKGIKPSLYHQDEVDEAVKRNRTVYIAEGEKDVDNLRKLGLVATTNAGGAGKWADSYSDSMIGATVAVVADKDEPGRRHARQVAQSLQGKAASVKVLELPGKGKDVSDWLAAGGTPDELGRLVAGAPTWQPSPEAKPVLADSSILTDTTNAERIAMLYGHRLRYDHMRGRWLLWDSHFWKEDATGEVCRLAIEAARERYRQSVTIPDLKERQRVAAWAIGSEQRGRLDAAVSLARNIRPIADDGKDWDADPRLFGVANGVVDLRTGLLRPGKPEDRVTLHTDANFDPAATCVRWPQFLLEVFNGNTELVDWIQRAAGYCVTGDTTEQVVFLCYGRGANGKSKFLGALRHVFGQYAYDAPFATFELTNRTGIPNDLAALERRRFVTSSETNEGTRLNEARIKALTGGDPCTARYLHHEYFTFQPVAKIWLAVNHKPKVTDDSVGFWRRVRLIPFTQQFCGDKDDKNLSDKLKAEAPGILNWLIKGSLEWSKRGLEPVPAAVTGATAEYQQESDPLSQFIAESCVAAPSAEVKATDLYRAYLGWAENQNMRETERLSNTAFGRKMSGRFDKARTEKGVSYKGIGLRL